MTDLLVPHQQRVVVEKMELDVKITALGAFFSTDIFYKLPEAERTRLRRQYAIMDDYSEVLGERIVNF